MMLTPLVIPLTKRALVIGGGIAGITAALDVANGGYEVVLVEKEDHLGGHVMELSATFPTLESPRDYLIPRIKEVIKNPNVHVHLNSEVESVTGYVGSFNVKIRQNEKIIEEEIGAIVTAPGFDLLPREKLPVFPDDPDIVDGLQFEKILSTEKLIDGKIKRPSDERVPQDIV